MRANTQLLWEAVKNATLYCRPKSWNGGEAEVEVVNGICRITASDDFVTITTRLPVSGTFSIPPVYVSAKEMKSWEKYLREVDGVDVELLGSEGPLEWKTDAADPGWWKDLKSLGSDQRAAKTTWDLNPERLALLSRLEPKGQYPLSWKAEKATNDINDIRWFWRLKYGPNTTGIIIPLDREDLELEDMDEVLW